MINPVKQLRCVLPLSVFRLREDFCSPFQFLLRTNLRYQDGCRYRFFQRSLDLVWQLVGIYDTLYPLLIIHGFLLFL